MPEIWGTAYIESARDKLVTEIEALKTQMAGYDPTFSHVYRTHNVADLRLNAVTVGLNLVASDFAGKGGGVILDWDMVFDIRVHTAYSDGMQDEQKQSRLLNSIANKLLANNDLGDGYRILRPVENITTGQQFEESDSLGGSLQVTIWKAVEHAQE